MPSARVPNFRLLHVTRRLQVALLLLLQLFLYLFYRLLSRRCAACCALCALCPVVQLLFRSLSLSPCTLRALRGSLLYFSFQKGKKEESRGGYDRVVGAVVGVVVAAAAAAAAAAAVVVVVVVVVVVE